GAGAGDADNKDRHLGGGAEGRHTPKEFGRIGRNQPVDILALSLLAVGTPSLRVDLLLQLVAAAIMVKCFVSLAHAVQGDGERELNPLHVLHDQVLPLEQNPEMADFLGGESISAILYQFSQLDVGEAKVRLKSECFVE